MYFRIFGCNDHGNGNWVSWGWYWLVGFLFVWMINTFVISSKLRGTGHPSRGLMLFWWHQSIRRMPLINVRCQNSSSESDDMIPQEDGQNFLKFIQNFNFREQISPPDCYPVACFEFLSPNSGLHSVFDLWLTWKTGVCPSVCCQSNRNWSVFNQNIWRLQARTIKVVLLLV